MNFTLRKAQAKDLAAIHNLVVKLAIYEQEPDAVTATLEDYQRDFEENIFEVIVAEQENEVIGMALYYMTYSTWKGKMVYLEDFVVKEAFRKFGVGQKIFDRFLAEAKEMGAVLVKWQVLDWNEPALNFYKKNKASVETNWWTCKKFLD